MSQIDIGNGSKSRKSLRAKESIANDYELDLE